MLFFFDMVFGEFLTISEPHDLIVTTIQCSFRCGKWFGYSGAEVAWQTGVLIGPFHQGRGAMRTSACYG